MARPPISSSDRKPVRGEVALDVAICLLFVLIAFATRLPFRSQFLHEHDSFNFALAMEKYDIAADSPHAPGYVYYVFLAKFISSFVNDNTASLILISIIGTAAGAIVLYAFGKRLWGRIAGVTASSVWLSAPLVWFYGERALNYCIEGFFSTWIAYLCYLSMRGSKAALWAVPIAVGLCGGFRPWLGGFLFPLWMYCSLHHGVKKAAAATALMILLFSIWYLANVILSGGWEKYQAALAPESELFDFYLRSGWRWPNLSHRLQNITDWVWHSCGPSLGFAVAFIAAELVARTRKKARWVDHRLVWFLVIWPLPALLLYVFIHLRAPGLVLTFAPCILLFAGGGVSWLSQLIAQAMGALEKKLGADHTVASLPTPWAAIFIALICSWGLLDFLSVESGWSLAKIRFEDLRAQERIQHARQFPPGTTVVIASDEIHQAKYYLRNYAVYDVISGPPEPMKTLTLQGKLPKFAVLYDSKLLSANKSEDRTIAQDPPSGLSQFYLLRHIELHPREQIMLKQDAFWVEEARQR